MIAQRRFKKLKYDYRHHIEVLRLRKKEEKELEDQGNKRAKEIAEQHYRVSRILRALWIAEVYTIFLPQFPGENARAGEKRDRNRDGGQTKNGD